MQSVFITTISGENSPNILESLAQTTRNHGGEWLVSKIIKLDGQFSAMMKVSIDQEQEEKLNNELKKTFPTLHFINTPLSDENDVKFEIINLVLDCEDRSGLTRDLTKALSDLDLNIENMEIRRLPVIPMGNTVYSAKLSISLPDNISKEDLKEQFMKLSNNVRINFD